MLADDHTGGVVAQAEVEYAPTKGACATATAKNTNMPIPDGEFQELRKLAAELILQHRLPVTTSNTILAGYGNGSACCLCTQPLTRTQIEYELTDATFTREGVRLHLWCHAAWQMELNAIGGPSTSPSGE
jgi:hypothetical protein